MPRYFLEVAYKGTSYSGFQTQENALTVQAEIENAHLEGANLKMAEGLTSEQLAEAHTDEKTILPA